MHRSLAIACVSCLPWWPGVAAQTPKVVPALPALPTQSAPPDLVAFVTANCRECHGGDAVKGGLDLGQPAGDAAAELWRWRRLRDRVAAGEMPPAAAEQPDPAAKAAFVAGVAALLTASVPTLPVDPGRSTIRRLSRTQWANCVRDLFGVAVATSAFPADDLGYGFDTIGDALTFSTLHLENYLAAATAVAAEVFPDDDGKRPVVRRYEAEAMPVLAGEIVTQEADVASCFTTAQLALDLQLPRADSYRLRAIAFADPAGSEAAKLVVRAGGQVVASFAVTERKAAAFVATLKLPAGSQRLVVEFPNDFNDAKAKDPKRRDRNLHIDAIEIEGPLTPPVVPPPQAWLHAATPPGGAPPPRLQALAAVALPRIWRRPCSTEEAAAIARSAADLVGAGQTFVAAQRFVLTAALVSPNFLFRAEPARSAAAVGARLSPTATAARLSFFLWASTPDDVLRERAAAGRLADTPGLLAEVDRMLADPRADALATDFAAQWLELKSLADRTPDPAKFAGFDDALRTSLRRESELLFATVLRESLPLSTLLLADFTHVDATLARFYGLPAPPSADFVRTPLPDALRERGGLLGHGSVLAVTSNPTRTSPVKRGKWVLENLLGQPPPPPPPGNDSLANEAAIDSSRSFREQLAQHRQRAACAACHNRMDALGFALEHYDAIGRHRQRDQGGDIDASGELPDGTHLAGLADLKRVVAADPAFAETVARKLFVYAVGRDLRPIDRLRLDFAVGELQAAGPVTLRGLIRAVVLHDAFLRGAPALAPK
jgi:mono/diheme cytochrome c family protein